jgi:hypothetical protein
MPRFDSALGSIHCEASQLAIDALLFDCGLRTHASAEPHLFVVICGGRDSEPEVALDLWEQALAKLREAERNGALPRVAIRGRFN